VKDEFLQELLGPRIGPSVCARCCYVIVTCEVLVLSVCLTGHVSLNQPKVVQAAVVTLGLLIREGGTLSRPCEFRPGFTDPSLASFARGRQRLLSPAVTIYYRSISHARSSLSILCCFGNAVGESRMTRRMALMCVSSFIHTKCDLMLTHGHQRKLPQR
jgi:hypothetical protein